MRSKVLWGLRLVAAGILLQTLYFKFSGAPESVFIFSTLRVEPYGRYFAGVSELAASVCLMIPGMQLLGAAMSVGIMSGALLSHLAVLGVVVQDDGGLLFGLACTVLLSSLLIVYLEKDQIPVWMNRIKNILSL